MGVDQFKESLKEQARDGGLTRREETSVLKQRVSKWADAVEHHGLKNFGDKIEILSVTGKSSYIVFSDGEYEKRSILTDVFPYEGKRIFPNVVQISNIDEIWKLPLPSVDKFGNYDKRYGINEEVYTCEVCRGTGQLVCGTCRGSCEVNCSSCEGRGEVNCRKCNGRKMENCHRCYGRGSIKGDSTINYKEITCPSCNGRQRLPCSSCGGGGTERCSHCTNGKVRCYSCSGRGVLTCDKCKGTGNLVRCEYLKDAFIHKHTEEWAHSPLINQDLWKRIEIKVSEAKDVAMIEDLVIPSEAFDVALDQSLGEFLKKTLSLLQRPGLQGTINKDFKIFRQRIAIRKVEVAEIAYRYEGKGYVIWTYGVSGIWAAISPISEIRNRIFENVQEHIKQKDLSTALENIDKTIVMAKGERIKTTEYKNLRNEIRAMIKRQYLIGGIAGGTIVPVIGNLLGAIIGLIYWNVFEGKIRLEKQRFFYPFFAAIFVGLLWYGCVFIKF